jgi:membrane-bound lytic murein transglycosylase A
MTFLRLPMITLGCLLLAGCQTMPWPPQLKPAADHLTLKETSFDQLPGWDKDAQGEAVVALQRSCAPIMKKDADAAFHMDGFTGTAADWQAICQDLSDAVPLSDTEARAFLEEYFTPYEMDGRNGAEGLFTGYYEPVLHGSYKKHGRFTVPLYGRPNDLVTVDLGDFKPGLEGQHIVGRVDKDKDLVPYYDRAEIEEGALKKQHNEIVWVDNAVDAFFLHIQGSGQVKMDNGTVLRVGYAAENGQPYVAIGKKLVERGALDKDNVSMQSIRDWLENNPEEAADVMNLDTSFIFFRKLNDGGPVGAEGVELMPRRSLAVDRNMVPYGVPIWLDAEDPDGGPHIQRLMVAQDTGGAITGAVRGDFFWGAGEEAAHKAGLMKSSGHAWALLPKAHAAEANIAAAEEDPPKEMAPPKDNPFIKWYKHTVSVVRRHAGLEDSASHDQ